MEVMLNQRVPHNNHLPSSARIDVNIPFECTKIERQNKSLIESWSGQKIEGHLLQRCYLLDVNTET